MRVLYQRQLYFLMKNVDGDIVFLLAYLKREIYQYFSLK